jgi:hypothetical protein
MGSVGPVVTGQPRLRMVREALRPLPDVTPGASHGAAHRLSPGVEASAGPSLLPGNGTGKRPDSRESGRPTHRACLPVRDQGSMTAPAGSVQAGRAVSRPIRSTHCRLPTSCQPLTIAPLLHGCHAEAARPSCARSVERPIETVREAWDLSRAGVTTRLVPTRDRRCEAPGLRTASR